MSEGRSVAKVWWWAAGTVWVLLLGLFSVWAEGIVPRTPRQFVVALLLIGPLLVLAEPILQVIAYGVARVFLPIATLGRIRVAKLNEELSFPWHGLARDSKGAIVISSEVSSILGFLVVGLFVVLALAVAARVS
jgi:hypothetical protein